MQAVGRLAKSARKTLSSLHTHSVPSPDGMGVRLSHFGPPKLNSFKGLLNLSTSSPTTDRPQTTDQERRGDRGCAATIKFNRATSPRHPVPSRRKLYIGLMGPSGNASNAAAAVMHSSLLNYETLGWPYLRSLVLRGQTSEREKENIS